MPEVRSFEWDLVCSTEAWEGDLLEDMRDSLHISMFQGPLYSAIQDSEHSG